MTMCMWQYRAENLTVGYDGKALIGDIDFRVNAGECILLCGANGTGKSTLLRTVAGTLRPVAGRCGFLGEGRVYMVPARIPKVRGFSVEEFIATSCGRDTDWLGRMSDQVKGRVEAALSDAGILHLAERDISTLSDGEFQKASICTALVQKSDLILLDEPTAFLDVDNKESVMRMIRDISLSGRASVLFSSHDIGVASRYCTRVFGMTGGRFYEATASCVDSVFRCCFNNWKGL